MDLSLIMASTDLAQWVPWIIRFERAPGWVVMAVCALAAGVLLASTWRSLSPLGPVRQWTALSLRLTVVILLIFALAGARWERRARDVEVIVLRDLSTSTQHAAGGDAQQEIDRWLAVSAGRDKQAGDRIGVIGFGEDVWVESRSSQKLDLQARPRRDPHALQATDIASAIQFGMAMFRGDAMQRLVLVSDGNANRGDLQAALQLAASRRIPIDVLPLRYDIRNDVFVERVAAPAWRREGEAFSLDVIIRNLNPTSVPGTLQVYSGGAPIDIDPQTPGVQSQQRMTAQPGLNSVHLPLGGSYRSGIHRFEVAFRPDLMTANALTANDSAAAFTVVRGRGRVLWVSGGEPSAVPRMLRNQGMEIEMTDPQSLPPNWLDLHRYDAIVLDNVPRGAAGLDERSMSNLVRYVQDLGGGLAVIGGPDAFGAGGWIGSPLEQVLPVYYDIDARVVLPRATLVIALDCSGSMGDTSRDGVTSKQKLANEAAALAVEALSARDLVGVVAFASDHRWVWPLQENSSAAAAAKRIREIGPGGGTQIFPALRAAYEAIAAAGEKADGLKHVLLVTDGQSPEPPDSMQLIAAMRKRRITLSTVGIGQAPDAALLSRLAQDGGGTYYAVQDPTQLVQIFIREARLLRRSFIQEQPTPVLRTAQADASPLTAGMDALPPVFGLVLTRAKTDPNAAVLLRSPRGDPILAQMQSGLGRVVAFTSDAGQRWSTDWLGDAETAHFWTRLIRGITRQQQPANVDVRTILSASQGTIVVEASGERGEALNFAAVGGTLIRPEGQPPQELRLNQTGPGRYEATFDASRPGPYIASLRYVDPRGQTSLLLSGAVANTDAEQRDFRSNDAALMDIVHRTGGRVLPLFDPAMARLYAREGLARRVRVLPISDVLLCLAMAVFLLDVANRRLAWEPASFKWLWLATVARVRGLTTVHKVQTHEAIDALHRVRARPNPAARFEGEGVDGDAVDVLGGAKAQASQPAIPPGGDETDTLDSLRAAKQRVRRQMRGKK